MRVFQTHLANGRIMNDCKEYEKVRLTSYLPDHIIYLLVINYLKMMLQASIQYTLFTLYDWSSTLQNLSHQDLSWIQFKMYLP